MRHRRWHFSAHAQLRRVLALLSIACFVASWFEALIPDVHDGDATAAEVARSDAPARALRLAPQWGLARPAAVASADGGDGRSPDPHPAAPHAIHVDHCGHSHAVPPAAVAAVIAAAPEHAQAPTSPVAALASVALSPLTRPPIA